jgi:diguanylate cyclase (GGDEF)-like protein
VTGWALWQVPRGVLRYVLIIEAITVAVVMATTVHVQVSDAEWVRFAILVGCALVNVELTLGVERVRDVTAGSGPVMHVDSVWWIAAMLTLPPVLANAVMVIIFTWLWLRIWRHRRPLYRWVFSVATIVLATYAGAAVLAADPRMFPGVPVTPVALGLAVLAIALRFLVNFSLVFGAIVLSTPTLRSTQLVDSLSERVLEIGAAGLGIMTAVILIDYPLLMVVVVAIAATLHRGILVAQFRKAARIDAKTGLTTADWWHQIADNAFQRAHVTDADLAVLMLDLDHFKRINDAYGHLAGDRVLRAVAQAINSEIRDSDTAGRWGGEEFVVLAPNVNRTELRALAERIRRRIHALVIPLTDNAVMDNGAATVQDLTVSIGGAGHPHPGITGIDDLVLAADTALYQAKKAGRDRVVMADTE